MSKGEIAARMTESETITQSADFYDITLGILKIISALKHD